MYSKIYFMDHRILQNRNGRELIKKHHANALQLGMVGAGCIPCYDFRELHNNHAEGLERIKTFDDLAKPDMEWAWESGGPLKCRDTPTLNQLVEITRLEPNYALFRLSRWCLANPYQDGSRRSVYMNRDDEPPLNPSDDEEDERPDPAAAQHAARDNALNALNEALL